ncbi:FtsQ-type POTRA domain-containing protein [Clostridium malenominatum]|uniref:FtsQ-type POTRA domain-containing protein n=1 Tax=Clostridium malenominatum TaxID=1539 RepID=A0ABN1IYI0_9CLOT
MGEVIPFSKKGKNELIIKRRRKKRIKKSIIFLIFLISIMTTLCLKHPFFNLGEIKVQGNKNIPALKVEEFSGLHKGDNIFYVNIDKAKEGIKRNPYILDVSIKRKLPSTIVIQISEREAVFYGKTGENYVIIDKYGVVLEKKKDIKGMNLVRLQGFDIDKSNIGEVIKVDNERKVKVVTTLSKLFKDKKDNYSIALVDLSDINNIKFFYKNIIIKVGNDEELDEKLNKAFNIILQKDELKNAKGYIDVGFKGNPVVFIED